MGERERESETWNSICDRVGKRQKKEGPERFFSRNPLSAPLTAYKFKGFSGAVQEKKRSERERERDVWCHTMHATDRRKRKERKKVSRYHRCIGDDSTKKLGGPFLPSQFYLSFFSLFLEGPFFSLSLFFRPIAFSFLWRPPFFHNLKILPWGCCKTLWAFFFFLLNPPEALFRESEFHSTFFCLHKCVKLIAPKDNSWL